MMLQKGFLKRHSRLRPEKHGNKGLGNFLLYGGFLIIVTSLIIMIANFSRLDSIVSFWMPFMIIGIVLVVISLFVKSTYFRSHR